jgi:hypothetical protein
VLVITAYLSFPPLTWTERWALMVVVVVVGSRRTRGVLAAGLKFGNGGTERKMLPAAG